MDGSDTASVRNQDAFVFVFWTLSRYNYEINLRSWVFVVKWICDLIFRVPSAIIWCCFRFRCFWIHSVVPIFSFLSDTIQTAEVFHHLIMRRTLKQFHMGRGKKNGFLRLELIKTKKTTQILVPGWIHQLVFHWMYNIFLFSTTAIAWDFKRKAQPWFHL